MATSLWPRALITACRASTASRWRDGEDRLRWILDQELDALVTEACRGRKLERVRPVDPYQVKR